MKKRRIAFIVFLTCVISHGQPVYASRQSGKQKSTSTKIIRDKTTKGIVLHGKTVKKPKKNIPANRLGRLFRKKELRESSHQETLPNHQKSRQVPKKTLAFRFFNSKQLTGLYTSIVEESVWSFQSVALVKAAHHSPKRILALGTGSGVGTFAIKDAFPDAEVTGVDFSSLMIERAQKRGRDDVRLMKADAARMPFPDNAFDVIAGASFLYLLPNQDEILREVRRVLAPGGTAAFLEPSPDANLFKAILGANPFSSEHRLPQQLQLGVALSTWRVASAIQGRTSRKALQKKLEAAALGPVRFEHVLGTLGLRVIAGPLD